MPTDTAKKDFFISYNKADRGWAEWIAWQLEAADYTVIIQTWDFRPGMNFMAEMHHALTIAERFIGVLSPHYLGASFAQQELMAALAKDPLGQQGTVVLVKVQPCELTGLLPVIIHIELAGLEEEPARDKLLAGVRFERAKPLTKPPFPSSTAKIALRFPGLVPAIWNVPHPRNPNFTGREELLSGMYDTLHQEGAAILTQTLHGLGGVGKTQTALEYVYRHAFDYDLVWWLGAQEPTKLAADYAALAVKLNLPEKDLADQPAVIAAVKEWLRTNQNWLLIFDNAQAPGEIKPYLPGGSGHVLVTSRNPNWGALAKTQPVPLLPREQAVEFLLKRTNQENTSSAQELAEALGDLPLALEQAGAYIAAASITLQEYLELFQTRRRELWGVEANPEIYEHTVSTTWSLNLEQAEQEAPGATALLNLCAFLAPDAIPRSLFEKEQDFLPPELNRLVSDPLPRNRVFTALLRYSLLEVNTEDRTIFIHRLVQAVIHDRLDEHGLKLWAEAAVQLVNAVFPGDEIPTDLNSWPLCNRLLPHAQATAGHAEALKVGLKAADRLLNQAGLYLKGRADYVAAKAAYERALAIAEAVFSPDHPTVAIRLNNLGTLLLDTNQLSEAEALIRRALAIDEHSFGDHHPNVSRDLNNLSALLQGNNRLTEAEPLIRRALAIDETVFGPDHPNVAIRLNNLARLLQAINRLTEAEPLYLRAVDIFEKSLGPHHPNVATALNNLATLLQYTNRLTEAEPLIRRALAIDETVFDPDHPNVAIRLNNLARLLQALGDLTGAKDAYERALAILEKSLGPDHPNTELVRRNLAALNG